MDLYGLSRTGTPYCLENGSMLHQPRNPTRRGFTLVEILIVVTILGILAAIVIPQYSNATDQSKENAVKANLFRVRQQIEVYRHEHNDAYPAFANFVDQMTLASNVNGDTAAVGTAGYPYGPYLPKLPANPFTDTDALSNTSIGGGGVGSSAWFYDETNGDFAANSSATHREW